MAMPELVFDYEAGWWFGAGLADPATLDRTFEVVVEPSGGGAPMQTTTILTATAGSMNLDTGLLHGSVDLQAFEGQSVRVKFRWNIPESFTGPGFFQLDNVLLGPTGPPPPPEALGVPVLSESGLALLFGLIALAGLHLLRRGAGLP